MVAHPETEDQEAHPVTGGQAVVVVAARLIVAVVLPVLMGRLVTQARSAKLDWLGNQDQCCRSASSIDVGLIGRLLGRPSRTL